MKYKHVVFDIDGTILDTEEAVIASLQETIFELQNRKVSESDLEFAFGLPSDVSLSQLGFKDTTKANEVWNNKLKNHFNALKIFPGVKDLINKLKKQNCTLGIITSKDRNEYKNDFSPFGLDKEFDVVVCVEDSEAPKPSPAPMLKYLQLAKADKENVLFLGDTIFDFKCASSANVDCGIVLWGNKDGKSIPAKYHFTSPDEVMSVLNY